MSDGRERTVIVCDGGRVEVVRLPDGRAALLVASDRPLSEVLGDFAGMALALPMQIGIGLGPNDRQRLAVALGDDE